MGRAQFYWPPFQDEGLSTRPGLSIREIGEKRRQSVYWEALRGGATAPWKDEGDP